ncbi:MAG: prepilin-type N-terminal cleavage/methylation domain-containing protein [Phycisphaerales bacterium]
MSTRLPSRNRGFTIVELLVVMGIIAILLALLAPALGGAKRRGDKFRETNALREVSKAWNLYANAFSGAALPGYLDPPMQGPSPGWNVEYEYHTPPPGAPGTTNIVIPQAIAAPWTWRLLPFLSYNHDVIHGHLDEPNVDQSNMTDMTPPVAESEAWEIADEPGFGYNGYYVGGYWEMVNIGGDEIPRYRFFGATVDLNSDGSIGPRKFASVVVRSISHIRRSTELVVFCSSSKVVPGVYKKWNNDRPGHHIVIPPWLADVKQWGFPIGGPGGPGGPGGGTRTVAAAGDIWTIEAFVPTSVPIARYTKSSVVVYADGHTANQSASDLMDMRQWIDTADKKDYQHLPGDPG